MPSVSGGEHFQCPTSCSGLEGFRRIRAKTSYTFTGALEMQKDIVTHGPILASLAVYKSFLLYQSGIYQKHWWENEPEGAHAVRILGWGIERHNDFWLVANSWSDAWGEKGYFRLFRGDRSCRIEELGPPRAGLPVPRTDEFFV